MPRAEGDISFKNIEGKLQVIWHVKCDQCKSDITAYKVDLPPMENGLVDKTTTAFQCPADQKIKILTTTDIYEELTKWQQVQEQVIEDGKT